MTDLASAAVWLLHVGVMHAWHTCLAYGRGACVVRYDLGPWSCVLGRGRGTEEYRPITPPESWSISIGARWRVR